MTFDPAFIIPLLFLGALSGLLAGLLGVGGGLVLVPVLAWMLGSQGVPPESIIQTSIGTAFGVIFFTSLSSLRAHHKAGAIRWPVVMQFTPGILIGSLLGAKLAHWLPTRELGLIFSFFIFFSGIQMLLDKKPKPTRELPGATGLAGMGVIIGVLSALVGAGGGFVAVPFMAWCNVNLKNAVATSAAMGFPIAVFSSVGYVVNGWSAAGMPAWSVGYLYLPAMACLASISVLTAPIGAGLAHRLPVKTLKRIFACMLFVLALVMLKKVLG
jgi:uncharacterized membrane protein YfcA